MATPEAELVRKWRQWCGLTLEQLGELCLRPVGRNRVYDIEKGKSSASVDTLLNVIAGLERSPKGVSFGHDDAAKLVRFFQGPDVGDALERFETAARGILAVRRKSRTR